MYAVWGPKAAKAVFPDVLKTPSDADFVLGLVTVVAGAGGTAIGGIAVDKLGNSVGNALSVCAVSSAVASEALDRAVLGLMGALSVLLLAVYYCFVRPWATQMGNPTISQKKLQSLTQHEREHVQREKKRLEEKARQKAMDGRKRRAASETDGGTAAGGYDSGEDSSGAEDARVVRQIADSKRTVSMTMGHGGADSNGGIATTTLDEMPLGTTV